MTYGHLRVDCLYTGISYGLNARYRVWESLYLYLLGFLIITLLQITFESIRARIFGRPFIKRFARCYRSVVCLSVLSVLSVSNVGVLWPNGSTHQEETWHAGRPRPWPHCVRWGPSSPPLKGHSPAPNFRPISVAAKWLHRSRCHLVWR